MDSFVYQINISNGGVPKTAVSSADITPLGIEGDVQKNRKYHGGPTRAVCLYSYELIQELNNEGHPITPGSIGENITLSGVDWNRMRPGQQLKIGADVILEITSYAVPCSQIAGSFKGKQFKRVSQKLEPGWARAYTSVIQTGTINNGDRVELI